MAAAQFNLGLSYQYGVGVVKDLARSQRLIAEAASKGHAGAEEFLHDMDAVARENQLNQMREYWYRRAQESHEAEGRYRGMFLGGN